ncbi:uncharacterized protein METZ01_LOCUS329925, partial [marine metagenome]
MATIHRRVTRSGYVRYRAQVRIKNQPWVSATFRKRSDATKWARQTESAQITRAYSPPNAPLRYRFSDAVDRYRREVLPTKSTDEQKRQSFQLQRWRDLLGDIFVDDITPGAIARVRDQLMGDPYGLAPATVVRYLAVLSHLYTVASSEWEWLETNPVRRVRRPKLPRGRVRFLDKGELSALLRACQRSEHPSLYPIVVLAVSTGMRKGEMLGLRWQDVDLVRNRITLEQTKNGDRRSVPLVGRARAVISEYARVRRIDTPLVFPSRRKPRVPADLRKPWAKAVETAGL